MTRLRPAAVVLDRILPRLGAEEVAERLSGQETTRSIPLVVVAEAADLGDRARFFRSCLARPVDRAMVASALAGLGAPFSQD